MRNWVSKSLKFAGSRSMAHPKPQNQVHAKSWIPTASNHRARLCARSAHRSPPLRTIKNDIETFYLYQKHTELREECRTHISSRVRPSRAISPRCRSARSRLTQRRLQFCAAGCWMRAKICILLLSRIPRISRGLLTRALLKPSFKRVFK